jgi:fibro-slime domain-containing protein
MARRCVRAALISVLSLTACGSDDTGVAAAPAEGPDGGAVGAGSSSADGAAPQTDASLARQPDGAADGTSEGEVNVEPSGGCGTLRARVRDFKDSHPDFEKFSGSGATPGIVASDLGADHTPVYANLTYTGARQTSSADAFGQWYHDVQDVNRGFDINIPLTEMSAGQFVYDSNTLSPPGFFPIDGRGFGNEGRPHNYHFTTEIHSRFMYRGGEVFRFRGDDDLWLFVNGKLALDLGGLHAPVEGTVRFDDMATSLGITPGNTYDMDIFHAERHTVLSNFRIETSIDCFIPVALR